MKRPTFATGSRISQCPSPFSWQLHFPSAPNELEAAVEANLDSPESPTLINPRVLGLQSRLFGLAMKRPPAAEAAGMGSTMSISFAHSHHTGYTVRLYMICASLTPLTPSSRLRTPVSQSRSNWPAGDTHSLAPCRRRTGPTALWLFLTLSWSNPLQKKKKQETVASL